MIRASLVWEDGHTHSKEHEWDDEDWYWVEGCWNKWVDRKLISHGVIWLTSEDSNSDHVVLDHYGEGLLFGEKL